MLDFFPTIELFREHYEILDDKGFEVTSKESL